MARATFVLLSTEPGWSRAQLVPSPCATAPWGGMEGWRDERVEGWMEGWMGLWMQQKLNHQHRTGAHCLDRQLRRMLQESSDFCHVK